MDKTLVIIDGNSLVNRAYYAIQRPMITKEGIYTQGIYGFLTMLSKIRADYEPAYITVAFDRKAPTFRHEQYDAYKAGRRKMPMELAMQIPYLKDVLAAMRINMLEIDGYEADDIIGTVARRAEEEGLAPVIITGDRDALQLASEKTAVIITKKGISEFERYDEDAIQEKYGFSAQQFIDYKGLMGDSSDNIPGIPGVGEKTALKLMHDFGSVEAVIERADEIPNAKLRQKVEDYAQQALMSKRLATIFTSVPIDFSFPSMAVQPPDAEKLVEVYVKLEFNSFLKKLDLGGLDVSAATAASHATYFDADVPTIILRGETAVREGLAALTGSGLIACKVFGNSDHKNLPAVFAVDLLDEAQHLHIPIASAFGETDAGAMAALADFISGTGAQLAGHDSQRGLYMLLAWLKAEADAHPEDADAAARFAAVRGMRPWFDAAVASYVLDPVRSTYAIKNLAAEYFGKEIADEAAFSAEGEQQDLLSDPTEKNAAYGLETCRAIYSLYGVLKEKVSSEKLDRVLEEAELPLVLPLAEMEAEGFAFHPAVLDEVGARIGGGVDALANDIYEETGETFNINSPQQLGVVLFEKMGLPSAKKTKTGYATGAEVLEKLRKRAPVVDKILEYRTLTKLRSTYVEGLKPLVAADGKIHAHFQQTVTATGRISCTEPNLQNIPVRQELGREIRKAFVPESADYVLVGADYSQIELRILAALSQDPGLLDDFKQGADIHRRTASRVFGVPEAEVTSLQRSNAKAVNFGVIYGMSSFGLSEGLNIARWEAEEYIQEYFKTHRGVKAYLDSAVADAKAKGYAETILGRKRTIPELTSSNFQMRQLGERLAMNTPIQGSAADIMKLAMIRVYRALLKADLRSRVILQVHDELIVQTHLEERERVKAILAEEMADAYPLGVPLIADIHEGNSWYELK
ncbi:MAG: DNA polymerase I [Clostridiales Family XIII bacterium]|jgi:DNA polymerase-1|nr:DNA polymerase I [Clostridiales Family XIII bacterium]